MSLDIYLEDEGRYGSHTLFSANITHNLNAMAEAAGIYKHLWRPEELEPPVTRAGDLIGPLRAGYQRLLDNEAVMREHDSPNGWGMYQHFVPFVAEVIAACERYPEATVRVSR